MIGSRVTYTRYMGDSKKRTGIVIAKYRGLTSQKNEVASGHGGTFRIDQKFPVDYYIIQEDGEAEFQHVRCSRITGYGKKEEKKEEE